MNQLFVVVLCRFSVWVRVRPAHRDATNKYLWRRGHRGELRPVFCVPVAFLGAAKKALVLSPSPSVASFPGNLLYFFLSSLLERFSCKGKTSRVQWHPCFGRLRFLAKEKQACFSARTSMPQLVFAWQSQSSSARPHTGHSQTSAIPMITSGAHLFGKRTLPRSSGYFSIHFIQINCHRNFCHRGARLQIDPICP